MNIDQKLCPNIRSSLLDGGVAHKPLSCLRARTGEAILARLIEIAEIASLGLLAALFFVVGVIHAIGYIKYIWSKK